VAVEIVEALSLSVFRSPMVALGGSCFLATEGWTTDGRRLFRINICQQVRMIVEFLRKKGSLPHPGAAKKEDIDMGCDSWRGGSGFGHRCVYCMGWQMSDVNQARCSSMGIVEMELIPIY
jgi:hypothetical protein